MLVPPRAQLPVQVQPAVLVLQAPEEELMPPEDELPSAGEPRLVPVGLIPAAVRRPAGVRAAGSSFGGPGHVHPDGERREALH